MFFGKKEKTAGEAQRHIPGHIAIIMDGNGRWAQKRGLPRPPATPPVRRTFRRIATYCKDIGVQYLTVYAFSTDNWKRPKEEVEAIMGLLDKYLREAIGQMERDRVRMKFFGDTTVLSPELQALIARTDEISTHFEGCQVNICVNYGGRDEILRAAKRYGEALARGEARELLRRGF
jgi:undecaprenyl diphosphate synthase